MQKQSHDWFRLRSDKIWRWPLQYGYIVVAKPIIEQMFIPWKLAQNISSDDFIFVLAKSKKLL